MIQPLFDIFRHQLNSFDDGGKLRIFRPEQLDSHAVVGNIHGKLLHHAYQGAAGLPYDIKIDIFLSMYVHFEKQKDVTT